MTGKGTKIPGLAEIQMQVNWQEYLSLEIGGLFLALKRLRLQINLQRE